MSPPARPRILLVEDEALVAVELADLLGFFGCQVDGVFGVLDDALAWLDKRDEPLEVIGLRVGSAQNRDRADTGLKRTIEGDRLTLLVHDRVHRRRSSFTS